MGMLRIVGLLLFIPLLDVLVLLVGVLPFLHLVPTVALVVLTGLVGLLLVRAEGRHTASRIQRKLARGSLPEDELIDGALLVAAGAFLLTPGLVTDLVGFLLVLPPPRYPVRLAAKRWVVRPYVDSKTGGFATGTIYTSGFPDDDPYDLDDDEYEMGRGSGSDN